MPGNKTYVQYANSAYFITKLFFYIMANSFNSIDFTTIISWNHNICSICQLSHIWWNLLDYCALFHFKPFWSCLILFFGSRFFLIFQSFKTFLIALNLMEFTFFLCFIPFWSILILFNPVWSCFLGVVFF